MSSTTRTTGQPTASAGNYRGIYQKRRETHRPSEEGASGAALVPRCSSSVIGPDYTDDESGFAAYSAYGDTVFDFLREALRANRDEDARRVFVLPEALAASTDMYA